MNDSANPTLIQEITLQNFLSFGPSTEPLPLRPLNLLIGPNGSGKSNLIEAFAVLRSTAVSPQSSNAQSTDAVLSRGGGVEDWIWKGSKRGTASLDAVVSNPFGPQPLRHVFKFSAQQQRFQLEDERLEYETKLPGKPQPRFFYKYELGHPILLTMGEERKLQREKVDLNTSILHQRRDPDSYPEITSLADKYGRFRIYREWAFGRNTVFREPQKADLRSDRLEEDFSNLGLFLNHLREFPSTKRSVLERLSDLYEGFTDFDVRIKGGTVQVFFTEGDYTIPATRLSDGTLRYLCLLAILCDPEPPPVICLEEPELGLHPDILPTIADLMVDASARTQLIVTTHSDVIVDAMTERPECVVVCERHKGQTEMKRLKADDLKHWLDQYRLGDLWTKGELGGLRW